MKRAIRLLCAIAALYLALWSMLALACALG